MVSGEEGGAGAVRGAGAGGFGWRGGGGGGGGGGGAGGGGGGVRMAARWPWRLAGPAGGQCLARFPGGGQCALVHLGGQVLEAVQRGVDAGQGELPLDDGQVSPQDI